MIVVIDFEGVGLSSSFLSPSRRRSDPVEVAVVEGAVTEAVMALGEDDADELGEDDWVRRGEGKGNRS